MLFDSNIFLSILTILIVPCIGWVWRISTTQTRLEQQVHDLETKLAELPKQEDLHDIKLSLAEMAGSLKVVCNDLSHLRQDLKDHQEAINSLSTGRN